MISPAHPLDSAPYKHEKSLQTLKDLCPNFDPKHLNAFSLQRIKDRLLWQAFLTSQHQTCLFDKDHNASTLPELLKKWI